MDTHGLLQWGFFLFCYTDREYREALPPPHKHLHENVLAFLRNYYC